MMKVQVQSCPGNEANSGPRSILCRISSDKLPMFKSSVSSNPRQGERNGEGRERSGFPVATGLPRHSSGPPCLFAFAKGLTQSHGAKDRGFVFKERRSKMGTGLVFLARETATDSTGDVWRVPHSWLALQIFFVLRNY